MSRWMPMLVVAVALSMACGDDESAGDAGCTLEACDAAVSSCNMAPVGLSRYCIVLPDAAYEATLASCRDACRIAGLGPFMSCVGVNVGLCEESNECRRQGDSACANAALEELGAACFTGAEARDATCLSSCASAQGACEAACPTDTYAACSDCALDCLRVWVDCKRACPAAP